MKKMFLMAACLFTLTAANAEDNTATESNGHCLYICTPEAKENYWDWQCYYDLSTPMVAGKTYSFSMRVKASATVSFPFWIETPDAGNTHYGLPMIAAGTTWDEVAFDIAPTSDCSRLLFNFGQFGGDLYFDDLVLVESGSEANMIANGDFEGDDLSGWSKPGWHEHTFAIIVAPTDEVVEKEQVTVLKYDFEDGEPLGGWGNESTREVADESYDGSKCMVVNNPTEADFWVCQMAIELDEALTVGETYYLHFWAKSETAVTVSAGYQNPDNYSSCGDYPSFNLTTEWKEYTLKTIVTGENCKRLCFNLGKAVGKTCFDDIEIYYMKEVTDVDDAISGVKPAVKPAGQVYTIGGQPVKSTTKGLYIIDGKKVVIK